MAGRGVRAMAKRILYLFDHTDSVSRLPLARAAKAQGYDVVIGFFGHRPNDVVLDTDDEVIEIPKPVNKFSPLALLKTMTAIRRAVTDIDPDLLHVVTLKYSFLSGLALRFMPRPKTVYTIAGLGFVFRSEGIKPKILRLALAPFLKIVLSDKALYLVIQNADDRDLLVRCGYAAAEKTNLVIGSGIDLKKFTVQDTSQAFRPLVLMVTRLVREKGVHIFAEAARILKEQNIEADFQIAGGLTTHNPSALTESDMQAITASGAVEWLGRVEDIPGLLAKADIVVYPSYYGEGVPRVLLEACAAGKPIVTTDHPGCKETVEEGQNGFLVPVKDAKATAAAIAKILDDPPLKERMGRHSRLIAEKRFDISQINTQTLDVYACALRGVEINTGSFSQRPAAHRLR